MRDKLARLYRGLRQPAPDIVDQVIAEHLTYLGTEGLRDLVVAVEEMEASNRSGAIIEAGVALGGSTVVLAATKRPQRRLLAFDAFGMIPPPSERDGTDVHDRYDEITSGRSSGIDGDVYYGYHEDLEGEVRSTLARYGYPAEDNAIQLVKGLYQDTMPTLDGPIALVHLDCDWYESVLTCLAAIAPHLAPGARIIVDDYDAWSGCRTAVDEFFEEGRRPGYRYERRSRLHVVRF